MRGRAYVAGRRAPPFPFPKDLVPCRYVARCTCDKACFVMLRRQAVHVARIVATGYFLSCCSPRFSPTYTADSTTLPPFKDTACLPISAVVLPHAPRGFVLVERTRYCELAFVSKLGLPHRLPTAGSAGPPLTASCTTAAPDPSPSTSYSVFGHFASFSDVAPCQLESEPPPTLCEPMTRVMDHPTT